MAGQYSRAGYNGARTVGTSSMYLWPSQNISYPNRLKFKHQCSLNFISELMQFTRVKQAGAPLFTT